MEFLVEAIQEGAEVKAPEAAEIPRFFEEMKEAASDSDVPVAVVESTEEPTTYLITKNESLQGDVHPITGVPFDLKTVELTSGEKLEGVFPKFTSAFEAALSEALYQESDYKQFKECNLQLLEKIEADPELKKQFSEEQLEQIKDGVSDGSAPDGYVWHHCEEPGVMQLVDSETHANTGHTGGRALWGGGKENR